MENTKERNFMILTIVGIVVTVIDIIVALYNIFKNQKSNRSDQS